MKRLTCIGCPKWFRGWCKHYGIIRVAGHPMCEVGYHFHKNEYSRLWMAAKRKGLKK